MKSTAHFKQTIQAYLDQRANEDLLFAVFYAKPTKNIDDCITYILNTVQKSGCNGFTDEEIFGMAVHYYDEDNIEVGKPTDARVVVNHVVELTQEEKEEARKEAIQKIHNQTLCNMRRPLTSRKPKTTGITNQASLF